MNFAIASYSFHRLLETGKGDIFTYIDQSKRLGAAQLDPWNAHLTDQHDPEHIAKIGSNPGVDHFLPGSPAFLTRLKQYADDNGLPFGCIAVDGGHIFEETEEARKKNREIAYGWLDVAEELAARQIRIDAGGPAVLTDEIYRIITDGYKELVARAGEKGIEILMENHWGPANNPENVIRILEAVEGLGLLHDSNNWEKERQEEAWKIAAPYTRSIHIKTFEFDENGNEPTVDIPKFMRLHLETGYNDVWGIESCPVDGDEIAGVEKTIALMRSVLE